MSDHIKRTMIKLQAYRRMFLTDDGELNEDAKVIMKDLRKFCRATTSTAMVSPVSGQIDPMAMAMAEGRREVFNRLNEFLHLSDKVIHNLREEAVND